MSNDMIVKEMINQINQLEKDYSNNKYYNDNSSKKDVVNLIIKELERLTGDEN